MCGGRGPAGVSQLPGCCSCILGIPCGLGHPNIGARGLETSTTVAKELDRCVNAEIRSPLVLEKNVGVAGGTRQPPVVKGNRDRAIRTGSNGGLELASAVVDGV